jgi:hypothetical protein
LESLGKTRNRQGGVLAICWISMSYTSQKLRLQIFSKLFPNFSLGGSIDINGLDTKKLGNAFFPELPAKIAANRARPHGNAAHR